MYIVNRSRSERVASIAQLLAGFVKHGSKMGSIVVNAKTLKAKEVTAALQAVIDAAPRVTAARGALTAAIEEEQRTRDQAADILAAVKSIALAAFKNKADILAEFGLVKRERRQLTALEKLEAVNKLLATREARHTMGRRQKERIHGTPPGNAPDTPAHPMKPGPTPAESAPSTGASPPAGPEPPPIVPAGAPVTNGAKAGSGMATNGGSG